MEEKYQIIRNYILEYQNPFSFETIFDEPFILKELNTNIYAWNWESTKENLGKVIILSASDNTIPYVLFDLLEVTFDTCREHLG